MLLGLVSYGSFGRAKPPSRSSRDAEDDDDADDADEARDDETASRAEDARAQARAARSLEQASTEQSIRLMFLASGCAALTYEVIWFHLMRLVIGASSLSVGIVLASFMGGMFLRACCSRVTSRAIGIRSRCTPRSRSASESRPLDAAPPSAIRYVYVGLSATGAGTRSAPGCGGTFAPPTALMGATLPAIARRYSAAGEALRRLPGSTPRTRWRRLRRCSRSIFWPLGRRWRRSAPLS
jgi:hypothetical protein